MLNQEKVDGIMAKFRRAYGAADTAALRDVLTDDFEWHMHYGASGEHCPTGRPLAGVEAMVEELRWRREHWTNVAYENLTERPAGDVILQTFTTKGVDQSGADFHVNVVDLYSVREDKIYRKDTYWKHA